MKRQWLDMKYDQESERWIVVLRGREHGLHCGESFGLSLDEISIPCRLELDQQWYVVMPGARFNLRARDTYKIEI